MYRAKLRNSIATGSLTALLETTSLDKSRCLALKFLVEASQIKTNPACRQDLSCFARILPRILVLNLIEISCPESFHDLLF